ncbi:helix-turn-helix transcriptional regulator [Eoetvoesiella caeni]|uniref:LuxR family transcriptional regulator n=1 Tax=Eoetvoesiella caeni TaxID=645616 RepID=A0A366H2I1_9BURK|nr:helix-turn-helix transcriptional regulator [Eoetvoesiella caeni]MCI2808317.1 helix-turn-helix transcriptional regulator [Eoetvoesiella caeni]NYT53681.1 helix-turn-helix transcriptional regulator [Eoetvoesiella caeni]RBP35985.1 LuxR family transcriptional regulator [Eoetvoesiella caeni]
MTTFSCFDTPSPFVHDANCVENLLFQRPRERRGSPVSPVALARPNGLNNQSWESLIDSIGSKEFFIRLLTCLDRVCQVDHTSLFQLNDSSLSVIAAISHDGSDLAAERVARYTTTGLWRFDPSIAHIRKGLKREGQQFIKVNFDGLSQIFREKLYGGLGDKIVLSGVRKSVGYSLNLLRGESRGRYSCDEINSLLHISGPLISIVAKHWEAQNYRPARALQASVSEIESCLETDRRITSREREVCARIIYGMCHSGIAIDLDVGEETVKTYRTRAYQKLGIGSQRELLTWYLSIWNPFDH